MTEIENATEDSFDAILAETPGPLIVEFWAEWCGPCQVLAPIVARLAREHPKLRVVKVDVDDEPGLAAEYGVYGIPTVVRFDGGEETTRVPGALPYEHLLAALRITAPADASPPERRAGRKHGQRWGQRHRRRSVA